MVKNPNWLEVNQLAILQVWQKILDLILPRTNSANSQGRT